MIRSATTTSGAARTHRNGPNSVWLVLLVGCQILANCGLVLAAIRNVSLMVEPSTVRRGQHATLRCLYNLDGAPLYSVKFYRGLREFYRYSPSELPASKMFPFPGIHVDASISNASQVVIRNVGFGLSGNFSCEVTADAPSFSTATAHIQMQVVELPESRPLLWTDRERYEPGDVLRANCSSPPSRPRVDLRLTLNNIVIYAAETQYDQTVDGLTVSRINLRLHLQSSHFGNNNGGGGNVGAGLHSMSSAADPAAYAMSSSSTFGGGHQSYAMAQATQQQQQQHASGLVLRCIAQVAELYLENTEIELGVPQRDPVPARVTSSAASSRVSSSSFTHIAWLLCIAAATILAATAATAAATATSTTDAITVRPPPPSSAPPFAVASTAMETTGGTHTTSATPKPQQQQQLHRVAARPAAGCRAVGTHQHRFHSTTETARTSTIIR